MKWKDSACECVRATKKRGRERQTDKEKRNKLKWRR